MFRFLDLVGVFIALFAILFAYFKWTYQYWSQKNVPFIQPTIPFGNSNLFRQKESGGIRMKNFYDEMKAQGWKHGGLYSILKPSYMVIDLDYLKNIMTKDFDYFSDRGFYYNEKDDPLSAHLFAIGGEKWRNLRIKLTPTFTSGKMKMMFQTLVDCAPGLVKQIDRKMESIDIKEVLGCFTTDIIGSCAFGLDFNTSNDNNSPFREYGRKAFVPTKFDIVKIIFAMSFPRLAQLFRLTLTRKDVSEFFLKVVRETVEYREKNNYRRKDFIQLLIDLKGEDGKTLTINEIAAQSFVFFIAGFETSSTTMAFVLYELSRRPDLQQKLRDEINTVLSRYEGSITYEATQEMKYMDQVINEALRMYPPVPMLGRKCVKDYKIPDQDVIIEKGTSILIPVLGIHYDQEYYPDPKTFDPERFNEENRKARHHYAHLPFGEGPRICIGMRFGLMQTKVGLATLLKNYKFKVGERTQEPLKFKVASFVLAAEGEIWLDAEKL
ncbi:cytochrome P450 6a2 [Tribolium castaneum]|nr:PREDICTED: cytochrome P450 6a2 [Tribolium castaneum]XP_970282.1 PREDICTED: cytochrome P450 6a2 [Tribolium castaneum]EFA12632.1 cytochrome P450 6BK6 [Tribolium castaneum]|eukprot:XP_008200096.1 PREDICTED: cytochrome P450 6a2 [Tribolium castaneum]